MAKKTEPRLRKPVRTVPLYPLNDFPDKFFLRLAERVAVHRATRKALDIEGKDWEKIFAECIQADWMPTNAGLDDIRHMPSSTAWGAKTVKGRVRTATEPRRQKYVRLISGRNHVDYSYDVLVHPDSSPPNDIGEMVLGIWNRRVIEVRSKFADLRTVVLIKDEEKSRVGVFECETKIYPTEQFEWRWNKNRHLEGCDKGTGEHKFTWQSTGSQFTIKEKIPDNMSGIQLVEFDEIPYSEILRLINFTDASYTRL